MRRCVIRCISPSLGIWCVWERGCIRRSLSALYTSYMRLYHFRKKNVYIWLKTTVNVQNPGSNTSWVTCKAPYLTVFYVAAYSSTVAVRFNGVGWFLFKELFWMINGLITIAPNTPSPPPPSHFTSTPERYKYVIRRVEMRKKNNVGNRKRQKMEKQKKEMTKPTTQKQCGLHLMRAT